MCDCEGALSWCILNAIKTMNPFKVNVNRYTQIDKGTKRKITLL